MIVIINENSVKDRKLNVNNRNITTLINKNKDYTNEFLNDFLMISNLKLTINYVYFLLAHFIYGIVVIL